MKLVYLLLLGIAVTAGVSSHLIMRGTTESFSSPQSKPWGYSPDHVIANGVTEGASLEMLLRPEVVGRITAIRVRENEQVEQGAVLVELENAAQKHQHAQALAELAQAEANLEKIRNGERQEKRQSVAAIEAARRIEYQHAKGEFDRAKKLIASKSISKSEHDDRYFNMLQTEAAWKQAKAELDLVEAPARPEDIALASAAVAAAKAKVAQARAELDKRTLTAPFSGRVLRLHAERGELVSPENVEPILAFADVSKIRVRAFVEELDCTRVQVQQTAVITSDALPNRTYTGRVVQVFPRMGKQSPQSNKPGEYNDVYFREVLIELDTEDDIPINLRVEAQILVTPARDSVSTALNTDK